MYGPAHTENPEIEKTTSDRKNSTEHQKKASNTATGLKLKQRKDAAPGSVRRDIIASFEEMLEHEKEEPVCFSEFNTTPPFRRVPRFAQRAGDSRESTQTALEDAIAENPELLLALPLSRENAFKLLMHLENNAEIIRAVRSGLALGTLNADSVKGMIVDRIQAARHHQTMRH